MRAKKSLGQNFLEDKKVLALIVQAGDVSNIDFVLEIGPGTGNLTEVLLEKAEKVLAIEKDKALTEKLSQKFKKK